MSQSKRYRLEQEVIRAVREWFNDYYLDTGDHTLSVVERDLAHRLCELDAFIAPIDDTEGASTQGAPWTSEYAAYRLRPVSGHLRRSVVDIIFLAMRSAELYGLSCEQVEDRLGVRHQSISAAITYLRQIGWLEDSGYVRTNRSGRPAIIWRLTEAAISRLKGTE